MRAACQSPRGRVALVDAARHPEVVLLHIMSRVDGVVSISINDERRTKHGPR
jgi:hypothetical protein